MKSKEFKYRLLPVFIVLLVVALLLFVPVKKAHPFSNMEPLTHMTLHITDTGRHSSETNDISLQAGTPEFDAVMQALNGATYYESAGGHLVSQIFGGRSLSVSGDNVKMINITFWNGEKIMKSALLTSAEKLSCDGIIYKTQGDILAQTGIWGIVANPD